MRNGAEKRRALGAVAQAIGGVFHVTATEDAAILAQQGCAHLETRIWRVSQFTAGIGFGDQFLVVHLLIYL